MIPRQRLVIHHKHAVFARQQLIVLRGVCSARHDVAGYLDVGDAGLGLLALAVQVFFVDELIDNFGGFMAMHLLHLHVHDDEAEDAVFALAWLLEALLDELDGHGAVIGLLDLLLRVG